MRFAKTAFLTITLVILFAALTGTSQAQLRQITLRVDGLACPFCAYGLEKNLKSLRGVKNLKIDLDKGVVTLFAKGNAWIPLDRLLEAVKDGGFTPKKIKLLVAGHVTTLATLIDDKEALEVTSEIQKSAKDYFPTPMRRGLQLPQKQLVLKIEKPKHLFLLLENPDKRYRKAFEKLTSIADENQIIVVTGAMPAPKKKARKLLMVLFVESFNVEKKRSSFGK